MHLSISHKLDRLERLLSLKGQLSSLRILRDKADRFTPGRTLKASSAEAILKTCLRRKGWAKVYRNGELTGAQHLELLAEIRIYGCAWLHHEAAAFLAANAHEIGRSLIGTIGQHAVRLFSRMKGFVKELFVAGSMALLGPRALTETELKAIDQQHQIQVAYFDRFERQLVIEKPVLEINGTPVVVGPEPQQPLNGTFASRAESYGASVWGATQEVARATAASVFTIERRVHVGIDDPCFDCVKQLAKHWQPMGTLIPIGDCQCRGHCHCHFEYKVDAGSDRVYYAGESPDNAKDFGSTEIEV